MAVSGSKRSFFEDVPPSSLSKRLRSSSSNSSPPPIFRTNAISENPQNPSEWVNLLVTEMNSAIDIDDARVRASRMLQLFQKSIVDEASQKLQNENLVLKQQHDVVVKENVILKHGVAVQHERLKQNGDKTQELQSLKQLLSQYEQQLRNLEMNNYALNVRLKQAEQRSSIPGSFHPHLF